MTNEKPEGQRIEDLMTNINAEMQRLGWTTEQGSRAFGEILWQAIALAPNRGRVR